MRPSLGGLVLALIALAISEQCEMSKRSGIAPEAAASLCMGFGRASGALRHELLFRLGRFSDPAGLHSSSL